MAKNEYLLGKKEYMRQYRIKNKEKMKKYRVEWRAKNPDKVKKYQEKQKSEEGKKYFRAYNKLYIQLPHMKKKRNHYKKIYMKNRYYGDSFWRLKRNLHSCINQAIHINKDYSHRQRKWEKIVGYDFITLKHHLKKLFTLNMSMKNYGELWSIDHIIPQCNWQKGDESSLKEIWQLSNVRPLLISKHRKKLRSDLKYANRD